MSDRLSQNRTLRQIELATTHCCDHAVVESLRFGIRAAPITEKQPLMPQAQRNMWSLPSNCVSLRLRTRSLVEVNQRWNRGGAHGAVRTRWSRGCQDLRKDDDDIKPGSIVLHHADHDENFVVLLVAAFDRRHRCAGSDGKG